MKIVYFSRTGTCKEITESLSAVMKIRAVEITDTIHWEGSEGYKKAVEYSTSNTHIEISTSEPVDLDEVAIVIAPMWAGTIAQPAKEFIHVRNPENTALLIVSKASTSQWPEDRSEYLFVGDIVLNRDNTETVLAELQAVLKDTSEG